MTRTTIFEQANNAKLMFSAISIDNELVEATNIINQYGRLLLSSVAKPGHWIECKPETLKVSVIKKPDSKVQNGAK